MFLLLSAHLPIGSHTLLGYRFCAHPNELKIIDNYFSSSNECVFILSEFSFIYVCGLLLASDYWKIKIFNDMGAGCH